MAAKTESITITQIRDLLPSLCGVGPVGSKLGWILLNNAACAQTPQAVIDRQNEYLTLYNVNQGESSPLSKLSADKLDTARDVIRLWLNAGEEVVLLGQSCTLLLRLLSIAYGQVLLPGDEIVVSLSNHECNISPWLDLQRQGVVCRFWEFSEEGYSCVGDLVPLINARTKIVAFSHTSNLLGEVNNCKEIISAVRAVSSSIVTIVDGAQFVPHKCPDVKDMDCDFFFFASYKAFGPGFGVLYGKKKTFASIPGFGNHYQDKSDFYKQFELGRRFQAGGEFGFLGVADYFNSILQQPLSTVCTRDTVVRAYQVMEKFEQTLITKLVAFLLSKPCWRIFGPKTSDISKRVGIVSIQHSRVSPLRVEQVCSLHNVYVRQGHLQAYRICEHLGIGLSVGVVRISFMHYNSVEEVDKLIDILDRIEASILYY